jgi:hypothetical protein
MTSTRDARGVEDQVTRQSLLLAPEGSASVFDKLESVGNVFHNLGKPCGSVQNLSGTKEYIYFSFDQFEFPFTLEIGKPPVFVWSVTSGVRLFPGLPQRIRGVADLSSAPSACFGYLTFAPC